MPCLQGAKRSLGLNFYRTILQFIKRDLHVLNLGCGMVFAFEEELFKEKGIRAVSIDLFDLKRAPSFVRKYIRCSVEEKLPIKEKFDVVTFFELVEHIDKTEVLFENCLRSLKNDGLLIFSFPNLASLYSRIELLLGFQPHILEICNISPYFGAGLFGKLNATTDKESLHHIRGITHKAMKELVQAQGFRINKILGYDWRFKGLFYKFPSIAPVNIFVCEKR